MTKEKMRLGTISINRLIMIAGVVVIVLFSAFYFSYFVLGNQNHQQSGTTITASAVAIRIQLMNQTSTVKAGSRETFAFKLTPGLNGTFYFALSDQRVNMTIDNVTSGDVKLPEGVQATYPEGETITGATNQTMISVQLTFSSSLGGLIPLSVNIFQRGNPPVGSSYSGSFAQFQVNVVKQ